MQVVYEGRMPVSYSQAYLEAGDSTGDYDDAFTGQVNGLLGARLPGHLTLAVGVHTGDVGIRVLLGEEAPPIGPEWEEVVEASFAPAWPEATLAGCLSDAVCTFLLDRPGYRVRFSARFSARGMDAGRDADVVMEDEPVLDVYELALWPAPATPDAILREGSEIARYRHRMQDPAFARAARTFATWGDDPPGERLLDIWSAPWLVELERDLAEALAAAEPGVQRAVAYWAAQRACAQAGIDRVDWVVDAVRTLQQDRLLPALFHDPDTLYERLDEAAPAPTGEPAATNGWPTAPHGHALSTIVQAAATDPLEAVVSTLKDAHEVRGEGHTRSFLHEVREELSRLGAELTARSGDGRVADHRPPFAEPDPLDEVPEGMDPAEYFHQRDLWGGQLPSEQLRAIGGRTSQLAGLDRDLAESLATLPAQQQRALAGWAARQACTIAGLADLDWVQDALRAVSHGEPLPELWQDVDLVWARLFPHEGEIVYEVQVVVVDESDHQPLAPEVTAVEAVYEAAADDPAQAVVGAVDALARGHVDPAVVLEDLRQRLTAGTLPPG